MPTKRTIKAEAVSQPEVVAPLTAKSVKATKAVKPAAASEAASSAKAPEVKAAAPKAVRKPAPAKAKAVKATKSAEPEAKATVVATAPVIVTHSVPTETLSLTALSDEISRVAYQLWLDGGRQDGRALEDWSRAEDLVKSRYGL